MPSPGDMIRNTIRVTLQKRLSPSQLGVLAGTVAKTRHEQLMSEGQIPTAYQRYVNGVLGAQETTIRFTAQRPGVILYKGSSIVAAAIFCLQVCRQLSPRLTGVYSRSWIASVDGQVWTGPIERMPNSALEIAISNYAPYARRIEQSFGRTNPAYRITQIAADITKRRFGGLSIKRQFVTLPSVTVGRFEVPYHLKRPPGGVMLYPAVVITR